MGASVNDAMRTMGGGDQRPARAAVFSADLECMEVVREAFRDSGEVELGLELDVPFTEIADPQLERLRRLAPEVVFLDLESDPRVGLKFAQFLLDQGYTQALIGTSSDVSRELLLAAMQAGILEFVPKPLSPGDVREALERVWRKTGRKTREEGSGEPGRVLTVFGAKGGSGSTTFATNLAVEIHRLSRKKTLLVDLDLELGETALLLGVEPKFSIVDLVRNFHRVDAGLLASYIERHKSGVELLSAPYEPTDPEEVSADRVSKILDFLRERYDYVVLDTPKTFSPVAMAGIEASDELYLLATADLQSLRNVTRCLPLLRRMSERKEDGWLRLIVNRFDPRQLIGLDEVEKTLQMEVFATLRNDYRSLMASINEGRPAVMDGKSPYAADVHEIAARVTGVAARPTQSSGLLSRVLGAFRGGGTSTAPDSKPPQRRMTARG